RLTVVRRWIGASGEWMRRPQFSLRDVFVVVTICAVVAWACSAVKVHQEGNFINVGATQSPTAGTVFPNSLNRPPDASEVALRFAIWAPVAMVLYVTSRYHARRKLLGLWLHYVSVSTAVALLLPAYLHLPIF